MIIIALGANMPSAEFGPPRQTLEAALARLTVRGIAVLSCSQWYCSSPVPASDQPDYVNCAVSVSTTLAPKALLALLHETEREFGRVRQKLNEARVLDLDIIDFDGLVTSKTDDAPFLPHPRLHNRAFVLMPLRDIAPEWRHPVLGKSVAALIDELGPHTGINIL